MWPYRDVLADDRAIPGLGQAVVVAVARPRLGLVDQQFVLQPRHSVIARCDCRNESPGCGSETAPPLLAAPESAKLPTVPSGAYHVPLRHLVRHVIATLGTVPVALMHCVPAKISGPGLPIGAAAVLRSRSGRYAWVERSHNGSGTCGISANRCGCARDS